MFERQAVICWSGSGYSRGIWLFGRFHGGFTLSRGFHDTQDCTSVYERLLGVILKPIAAVRLNLGAQEVFVEVCLQFMGGISDIENGSVTSPLLPQHGQNADEGPGELCSYAEPLSA
jgi:hypothetical protein